MPNTFINIPNFHVYRPVAGRGGGVRRRKGVCTYVGDNLESNKISQTAVNNVDVENNYTTLCSVCFPRCTTVIFKKGKTGNSTTPIRYASFVKKIKRYRKINKTV